jgi:hypothetical protein
MTIAQHGAPTSQAGPVPGPAGAGGPPAPPQGFGWQPAPPQPAPLPVKRGKGLAAAVGAAIVLSAAALTVGIIALVRPAPSAPTSSVAPASSSAHPAGTTAANRAFCTDIAPLMTESNKTAQAFNRPAKNSPEWKAGVPAFVNDTKTWVGRMQPVIDSHGDADPYLLRSMQRFVDDRRNLVADLQAGDGAEWMPDDQTSWNDSLSAGSGPLSTCWDLGVKW